MGMIYQEGTDVGSSIYSGWAQVVPNVKYQIKLEVLRSDLGDSGEKVKDIMFDGISVGECNPPGADQACDFFDCTSRLTSNEIDFKKDLIEIKLEYVGHSKDCDCDTTTWECSPENTVPLQTPMVAAARVTLTRIGKTLKKTIFFYCL